MTREIDDDDFDILISALDLAIMSMTALRGRLTADYPEVDEEKLAQVMNENSKEIVDNIVKNNALLGLMRRETQQ
jgi:uncharacterized protein YutE (UPF0331/DUF86 family)